MKVVILQPSYIPWRGYFHQIQKADLFVFYDDVQYDRLGWRNRNRVKTANGVRWLTIPVHGKGAVIEKTPINAIEIAWETDWAKKHWATIQQSYSKAPYFRQYAPLLGDFYTRRDALLADFTIDTTIALARELGLSQTEFMRSSSLQASGTKTEHLIDLLLAVGATHYISGPAARAYLDEAELAAAGITLEYMTYDYPEYAQPYPPYDPQVSVIDLLMMQGPNAASLIWRQA